MRVALSGAHRCKGERGAAEQGAAGVVTGDVTNRQARTSTSRMNDSSNAFHRLRSRLQGIAYGMLGSVAEAEEVAQDVWLRWNAAEKHALESAEAWLVAVTTRLSIDRLRSAKVQRAQYEGMWLPEPLLTDSPATPEQILERADEVSLALLVLLERLSPEARAAFVLREVFDAEYAELAQMVGKTEAACRQLVRRAKAQIRADRPRNQVPREVHIRLMRTFSQAMSNGDFAARGGFRTRRRRRREGPELSEAAGRRPAHRPALLRGEPAPWSRSADRIGEPERRMRPASIHRRHAGIGASL